MPRNVASDERHRRLQIRTSLYRPSSIFERSRIWNPRSVLKDDPIRILADMGIQIRISGDASAADLADRPRLSKPVRVHGRRSPRCRSLMESLRPQIPSIPPSLRDPIDASGTWLRQDASHDSRRAERRRDHRFEERIVHGATNRGNVASEGHSVTFGSTSMQSTTVMFRCPAAPLVPTSPGFVAPMTRHVFAAPEVAS